MCVDRGIPGSSSQILPFSVRNMLSISLDVSFGQSEIDEEDLVTGFIESHTEVIWFYVSMYEVSVVDVFDSSDHLVDDHQDSFEGELSKGVLEEVFERGAHQIHN